MSSITIKDQGSKIGIANRIIVGINTYLLVSHEGNILNLFLTVHNENLEKNKKVAKNKSGYLKDILLLSHVLGIQNNVVDQTPIILSPTHNKNKKIIESWDWSIVHP